MHFYQLTAGIGEDKDGKPLSPDQVAKALNEIRTILSVTFGGYTELDTMGGWMHEGRLVQEHGKTWQVAVPTDLHLTYTDEVAKFAAT